jgi:Fe2+ transport system protein FeoA
VSVAVQSPKTLVKKVGEAVKEAIRSRENEWRELNIAEHSLKILKDEIVARLRELGVNAEPDIYIHILYSAKLSPEAQVKVWIKLPKISCVAMLNAESVAISASLWSVEASIRRGEASDINVQCWYS